MSREARSRRNGPRFTAHVRAHHEVLADEFWFGDGPPVIGKQFTAARANERKDVVLGLLFQAAEREHNDENETLARRLGGLADKIFYCRPMRRCGSLACPECHRAFQKAKVAAQRVHIKEQSAARPAKALVMVSVIPLWITYTAEQLSALMVHKLNRWLKDALTRAGFKRVMLGSIDFSWEANRGIYQPHWHIAMWTADKDKLLRRLKQVFPNQKRGDRPAMVSKTYSLGFIAYQNKAIKLPALLRNNRRGLPYLLLALDRTEPFTLMVMFGTRLSAQAGRLNFARIQRR